MDLIAHFSPMSAAAFPGRCWYCRSYSCSRACYSQSWASPILNADLWLRFLMLKNRKAPPMSMPSIVMVDRMLYRVGGTQELGIPGIKMESLGYSPTLQALLAQK
ncbi:hypothetical protein EYF80_004051 [Liparis tanakae]|uniref:Uncharacterized protein n=1 Tax=Liparis tanakae TaxID=230148 RepID=A0A4Z2J7B6_9TELE|nr:hypothetical protein EYF80_004051 [Liparis tanakae]